MLCKYENIDDHFGQHIPKKKKISFQKQNSKYLNSNQPVHSILQVTAPSSK